MVQADSEKETNTISCRLRSKLPECFISFFLSLIFALSAFTAANPIWGYSGVDSACFIVMGRGIINGLVPYKDLADNKGFVLYFMNALGQWLFGSTHVQILGIWFIELIFLFGTLLLIGSLAELFKCGKKISIILQILYLIAMFPLVEFGNMGEEYTCFFTLLGIRLCARYLIEGKQAVFWQYGLKLGVLFSLCFFVRPNNALPLAGMLLVLAVSFICNKEWKKIIISAGFFAAGASAVMIPMAVYLVKNDALYDCLNQTFLANMNYFDDSGNSFISLLSTSYGHKALIYFLLCFFGIYTAFERWRNMRIFIFGIFMSSVFSFLSAFISGFSYLHYLLIMTPVLAVCILLAVSGRYGDKLFLLIVMFILLSFSAESPRSFIGNLTSLPQTAQNYFKEGSYRTRQMQRVVEHIPERERSEVYILEEGESKSTDLYVQMDLLPCRRIFICGDRFARIIPEMDAEYSSYFSTDKPKWLILAVPLDDLPMAEQKHMIQESYSHVFTNDYDVSLYRLNT